MIFVELEKLNPAYKLPVYKTKQSACADLYLQGVESKIIKEGEIHLLPTGIKIKNTILANHLKPSSTKSHIQVHCRSGLGVKGLTIPNGPGIIDLDYRDEIMVILTNLTGTSFTIVENDRIGQLLFVECAPTDDSVIYEGADRLGGFGSTGS